MIRSTSLSIFMVVIVLLVTAPGFALAKDCSNKQIKKYCASGMSTNKIAKKCGLDQDDVEDIVGTDDCTAADPDDDAPSKASQQTRHYCCDNFGNSRCIIATGSNNIGDACYCNGIPGVGRICR